MIQETYVLEFESEQDQIFFEELMIRWGCLEPNV